MNYNSLLLAFTFFIFTSLVNSSFDVISFRIFEGEDTECHNHEGVGFVLRESRCIEVKAFLNKTEDIGFATFKCNYINNTLELHHMNDSTCLYPWNPGSNSYDMGQSECVDFFGEANIEFTCEEVQSADDIELFQRIHERGRDYIHFTKYYPAIDEQCDSNFKTEIVFKTDSCVGMDKFKKLEENFIKNSLGIGSDDWNEFGDYKRMKFFCFDNYTISVFYIDDECNNFAGIYQTIHPPCLNHIETTCDNYLPISYVGLQDISSCENEDISYTFYHPNECIKIPMYVNINGSDVLIDHYYKGECYENNVVLSQFFEEYCIGGSKSLENIEGDMCMSGIKDHYLFCHSYYCNGKSMYDIDVCSGRGECTFHDVCECENNQWESVYGSDCEFTITFLQRNWYYFLGGTVSAIIILLFIALIVFLVFLVQQFKIKKQGTRISDFQQIDDIDILLEEKRAEWKGKDLASLNINKELFLINYDDLKIIKKIGSGGSSGVVFSCTWNNKTCAFKCFKTSHMEDLCGSQERFTEFEREVEILSSIHHPHIAGFLGAILKPPRVGILMEYCVFGDLKSFLLKYKENNGVSFFLKGKIRILQEISSAMAFLHSKNIIHRDLKPGNVLITKDFESKVMDFGLSKIVKSNTQSKTRRVGTSIYMAPEVVLGGNYSELCDCFSFGIIIYNVITEDFFPYGEKVSFSVEHKVANDPTFRPDVNREDKNAFKECKWTVELMKTCWEAEPSKRKPFNEISSILLKHMETQKNIAPKTMVDLIQKKNNENEKGIEKNESKNLDCNIKKYNGIENFKNKDIGLWKDKVKKRDERIEELEKELEKLRALLSIKENSIVKNKEKDDDEEEEEGEIKIMVVNEEYNGSKMEESSFESEEKQLVEEVVESIDEVESLNPIENEDKNE